MRENRIRGLILDNKDTHKRRGGRSAFREDYCRVRKDHAPENFGIIRHMAINLLKHETSFKGGIQTKRLKAAWDHNYMLKVLAA